MTGPTYFSSSLLDEICSMLLPIPDAPLEDSQVPKKADSPLDDSEALTIARAIESATSEIEILSSTLSRLKHVLNALEKRHEALVTRKALHQHILSPLRRLPAEILAQIFCLCLELDDDVFDMDVHPWALGRVCQKWRNVSRGTPTLWLDIVTFALHTVAGLANRKGCAKLVRIALVCSRPLPLAISIPRAGNDLPFSNPVLRVILGQRHRFHKISFPDAIAPLLKSILPEVPETHDFPMLETLDITICGHDSQYIDVPRLNMFAAISSLTVDWIGSLHPHKDGLAHCFDIYWRNLRSFNARRLTDVLLLQILSLNAPILEELYGENAFEKADQNTSRPQAVTAIRHQCLTSFRITEGRTKLKVSFRRILQTLRSTCLEELQIGCNVPEDLLLLSLITSTSGSLKKLDIRQLGSSPEARRNILGLCPNLEELVLTGADNEDIRNLDIEKCLDSDPICPRLRSLKLVSTVADGHFVSNMIESRFSIPLSDNYYGRSTCLPLDMAIVEFVSSQRHSTVLFIENIISRRN